MTLAQAGHPIEIGETDDTLQCPFCGERGPSLIGVYNGGDDGYEFQCSDGDCAMPFLVWGWDYTRWREQVLT